MNALSEFPLLTTAQMVEVDRLMIEEWHINLVQMMENAGRSLAEITRRYLGGTVKGKPVVVLCGTGNNGGGGMVAARHLHNWGAQVALVVIGSIDHLKDMPAQQLNSIQKMGLVASSPNLDTADVILDAMIGYGLRGSPRPPISDWINRANASRKPIIALDTPSGLDTTSGIPSESCIRAGLTLTLALPKVGLVKPSAQSYVGDLFLADIGVPPEVYAAPSLRLEVISPFGAEPIVKLS